MQRMCSLKLTAAQRQTPQIKSLLASWPDRIEREQDPEYCDKLKVSQQSWDVIEDVIDLRRGLPWVDGGKSAQPARWFRLVSHADQLLAKQEREQLERDLAKARRQGNTGTGRSPW